MGRVVSGLGVSGGFRVLAFGEPQNDDRVVSLVVRSEAQCAVARVRATSSSMPR